MNNIACENCSGERAEQCAQNFQLTRDAIAAGVDQIMNDGWLQLDPETFEIIGRVEPADPASLEVNAMSHRMLILAGFAAQQAELGCSLTESELEAKLAG